MATPGKIPYFTPTRKILPTPWLSLITQIFATTGE